MIIQLGFSLLLPTVLFEVGKQKQVSLVLKTAIIALSEHSRLIQKEIGEKYEISQNTVTTIIKDRHETDSLEVRQRSDRPKIR